MPISSSVRMTRMAISPRLATRTLVNTGGKGTGALCQPAADGRTCRVSGMDEGLPIAYEVLDKDVPVYASGGERVGTVDHVVSAPEEDIFHGIVIRTELGQRVVAADQVGSLHERGVDLSIDAAAAAALPDPHGGAPAWRSTEPGVKPSRWQHFVDLFTGADPRRRNWTDDN